MSRVSLPAILLATALALPVAATACASEPVAEAVGEGEDGPVKYEFRDESEDGSDVQVSVICLTGDEAKPENKAAALEKAIGHMEAEGEREAAHRARTLEKLKAELAKLKAESE